MADEERMVWWETCDNCLTTIMLAPHPERDALPEPNEWDDEMPSCPVCGRYVKIGNSDFVHGFRLN